MDTIWNLQLFGQLQLERPGYRICQFRTQKTAALLAYLGYYPQPHPREKLIDLLWPDADLDAGRNSLRVALNALRAQLEIPGVTPGSILITSRTTVQLDTHHCQTDVAYFEWAIAQSIHSQSIHSQSPSLDHTDPLDHQIAWLMEAVYCYQDGLLPNLYLDWVEPERQRLADLYLEALRHLSQWLMQQGDLARSLDYAHKAVQVDPLGELNHCQLMRLYVTLGRPSAAYNQYRELRQLLNQTLNCEPSTDTQRFATQLFAGQLDG